MQQWIILTSFTGTGNVQERQAHKLYLPYLSYSLHIKYSSFIYRSAIGCPPKKSSCFPSPKAAAISILQTQGLGAQLPQHCRTVLEEGHPLWRGRARISQACKGKCIHQEYSIESAWMNAAAKRILILGFICPPRFIGVTSSRTFPICICSQAKQQ